MRLQLWQLWRGAPSAQGHRPTGTRDDNLLRKQNRKEASRSGRACRPTGWSSVKMMKSASGKLGPCSCMTCAAAGARVLTWDSFAVVPPASLWPPQACPALACHELACKGCCTETPTAAQAIRAAVQPLKAGKAADKSAHLIEYQLDVVLPGLVAPLLADNVPFAAPPPSLPPHQPAARRRRCCWPTLRPSSTAPLASWPAVQQEGGLSRMSSRNHLPLH